MKPTSERAWDKTLSRYFSAVGIPLSWDARAKRFTGVAGHVFARRNPRSEADVWKRMPEYVRRLGSDNAVIFITNKQYGDSIDDSFVVMQIRTFIPMMKALVDSDKERWTHAPDS